MQWTCTMQQATHKHAHLTLHSARVCNLGKPAMSTLAQQQLATLAGKRQPGTGALCHMHLGPLCLWLCCLWPLCLWSLCLWQPTLWAPLLLEALPLVAFALDSLPLVCLVAQPLAPLHLAAQPLALLLLIALPLAPKCTPLSCALAPPSPANAPCSGKKSHSSLLYNCSLLSSAPVPFFLTQLHPAPVRNRTPLSLSRKRASLSHATVPISRTQLRPSSLHTQHRSCASGQVGRLDLSPWRVDFTPSPFLVFIFGLEDTPDSCDYLTSVDSTPFPGLHCHRNRWCPLNSLLDCTRF